MSELASTKKLRELRDEAASKMVDNPRWVCARAEEIADEIEREVSERYMLKSDVEMDKNAVQEYNLDVQVVAGQKIEYTTELRHRCGATTSMSVAFRLE